MQTLKYLVAMAVIGAMCVVSQASAQGNKPYVVIKGNKSVVDSITATATGSLTLTSGGGGLTRKVDWKDCDLVYTPMPAEIRNADDLFNADKFNECLAALDGKIRAKYQYLGWGGYIAHLRGRSYLGLEQPAEAEKVLIDGMRYAPKEGREGLLNLDLVQAFIEQGDDRRMKKAKEIIDGLSATNSDELAFLYNMQGKMLAKQNKKREALLKHLSVILIFDNAGRSARLLAYDEAIGLMRDLNDNREGYLTKRKSDEFNK